MIDPSVARRYARALLSLALDQGDGRDRQEAAERYGAQLSTIAGVLAGSTEVRSALFEPSKKRAGPASAPSWATTRNRKAGRSCANRERG